MLIKQLYLSSKETQKSLGKSLCFLLRHVPLVSQTSGCAIGRLKKVQRLSVWSPKVSDTRNWQTLSLNHGRTNPARIFQDRNEKPNGIITILTIRTVIKAAYSGNFLGKRINFLLRFLRDPLHVLKDAGVMKMIKVVKLNS
jgi:hypothetical protein